MIDKSTYFLVCSIAPALDLDIKQTAGSRGHLSMGKKIDACMPQCVCCVQVKLKCADDVAKSGKFIVEFSWV